MSQEPWRSGPLASPSHAHNTASAGHAGNDGALCVHNEQTWRATEAIKEGTAAGRVISQAQCNQRALARGPTKTGRTQEPVSLAAASIICARPHRACSPLHGPLHRAPMPPRSSHPPKSVLVVRCSPSHSFLLRCLSINAAASTNTQRAAPFVPFAAPRNQGVDPKLHSGPHYPRPQRAAFRIWQSRASLSESTAS